MMLLDKVKAVIFDLDGTMVDSMWMWTQIDIDFLEARKLPFTPKLQQDIEGMSFHETATYFAKTFNLKETEEELMEIWIDMAIEKYRSNVPLKPGMYHFLNELKERGIKMGIATSNARMLFDAVANRYHFYDYIDVVVTSDEVTKGKPAPDVYLEVARRLDVEPGDCLVFEDIVNGIKAGLAAGMAVCAVRDKFSEDQDDEKRALAHYYIDSYEQIIAGTQEVL